MYLLFSLNSINNKISIIIKSHCPASAPDPGTQLLPVSGCSITVTLHNPAYASATVLHQDPDVQCHLLIENHLHHMWLHGSHQGPGLLTAKTNFAYTQNFTPDTVQDDGQVTATDILDISMPHYSGDQGGQVRGRDWGQVNIPQPQLHQQHRLKQSMVSLAGCAGDWSQITENVTSLDSLWQILNHSSIKRTISLMPQLLSQKLDSLFSERSFCQSLLFTLDCTQSIQSHSALFHWPRLSYLKD